MSRLLRITPVFLLFSIFLWFHAEALITPKKFSNSTRSKISEFICNVIKDVAWKDRKTDTISVTIFKNVLNKGEIDEIFQCLPKRLSLLIIDYTSDRSIKLDSRKASIVIMMADKIDMVRVYYMSAL